MKRNLFKRGMAGLLSLVMCLTALVGLGTTTAFAAGEQAEVYLISFPRSGDANLDYGGSWGHPNLQYMNGWYSGNSKYTTIRAMHSYEGNICYCIEPGTAQETGDRYTSKDETFWDNLPADFNVREKLTVAKRSAQLYPDDYTVNVEALERVQPKDLTASEIAVRLGATWLPTEIVEQFMFEFLGTPRYAQWNIKVHFSAYTGEWNIEGKSYDRGNVKAYSTYGTERINAYKSLSILEPVEYTKNDGSTGIAYNVKKVFDVAQTSGKKPAAPTLDRDPRKLVAIMLDTAPIDVSTVDELPSPNMGAFYKNEDQTLYIKRDIGDSVALCQCVAQELGHAQLWLMLFLFYFLLILLLTYIV